MAWEWRGDTEYYYHPRRVGGRVVRDYHGSGPVAQVAADLIVEARDRRAAVAGAIKAEQSRLVALDVAMDRLDRACDVMECATLLAGGNLNARRRRRVKAAGTGGSGRPRAR